MHRWIKGLTIALALIASQAFAQQQPIVIKFSHVVAEDTPKGKAALRFKQLAEERTQGRVKVEVYPNSTLYKDKEELEALQLGAVQMLAPSLAKFGPLGVKEFEVFDLPYIFPDKAVLQRVEDGPIGASLFAKLEPKGFIGLAYWDNGFKVMSANRPLHVPADFRGLKMRIQSSKVLDAQFRALGAIPQVMAFSDVYQALQTGVVDGTENPPSNLYTQRMNEVQKYVTVSNHGYLGYAVIVNKTFWQGLPPDIRTILEGAMKDATRYGNAIAQQENDDALAKVKATGKTDVYYLTDAEKAQWKAALLPVQTEMQSRIGKDLIDSIHQESAALGYKYTGFRLAGRILDRLEEIIIASLIAGATVVIFVSVVHRFASGVSMLQPYTARIDMSWAQELCIFMFVWMAKFGAAYGVRAGTHVGVDVLVNRLGPGKRRVLISTGLVGGVIFTGIIGTLGANLVWQISHTDQTSEDMEVPMWIVYLCVPLGSYLMCLRFVQTLWHFLRTGGLPHRDNHVDGLEDAELVLESIAVDASVGPKDLQS